VPEIAKLIKAGTLRWLRHLCRMQEQDPCKKITFHNPQGTKRVGTPAIKWLDSVDKIWR